MKLYIQTREELHVINLKGPQTVLSNMSLLSVHIW